MWFAFLKAAWRGLAATVLKRWFGELKFKATAKGALPSLQQRYAKTQNIATLVESQLRNRAMQSIRLQSTLVELQNPFPARFETRSTAAAVVTLQSHVY